MTEVIKWRNPQNLPCAGEGYRFTVDGEGAGLDAEYIGVTTKRWSPRWDSGNFLNANLTYRVPITKPLPDGRVWDGVKLSWVLPDREIGRHETVNGFTPTSAGWHRTFKKSMLEGGWRPLLLGEEQQSGDQFLTSEGWRTMMNDLCNKTKSGHLHRRTRRPVPMVNPCSEVTPKLNYGPNDFSPKCGIRHKSWPEHCFDSVIAVTSYGVWVEGAEKRFYKFAELNDFIIIK